MGGSVCPQRRHQIARIVDQAQVEQENVVLDSTDDGRLGVGDPNKLSPSGRDFIRSGFFAVASLSTATAAI